jgi:hypothetical protein
MQLPVGADLRLMDDVCCVEPSMVLSLTMTECCLEFTMSVDLLLCQYEHNIHNHIAIVFQGSLWLLCLKQKICIKMPRWAASDAKELLKKSL